MNTLLELGLRQGSIIELSPQLSENKDAFTMVKTSIEKGRFGLFNKKNVNLKHLFVVLTQDCSIAKGKCIELAQLTKKDKVNVVKHGHLLLGKDYNKLFLNINNQFYEIEESLLTKIESDELSSFITNQQLIIKDSLSKNNHRILINWRILTYTREPYPDCFNRQLSLYLQSEGAWFITFLQENSENIDTIRVYVSPDSDENAEKYQFSITALLTQQGESKIANIENKIKYMVEQFSENPNIQCLQMNDVDIKDYNFPNELILDFAVTLSEFTFANAYLMRSYNFQYLCY